MHKAEKRSAEQDGFVYEVRALTNRWTDPQAGPVISSHRSARAAQNAFDREPQFAEDGTGRTTYGNYVAKAVVRVDDQGRESMMLAPPIAGSGLRDWPYAN
jgi:hypothetical protein